MMKRTWITRNFLWSTVVAIGILLLSNIYLIYQNSFVIEQNRILQVGAESIKVNTLDISRNLHLVDMGARGYTLIRKEVFKATLDNGLRDNGLIIDRIRKLLAAQNFPMKPLEDMSKALEWYYGQVQAIEDYLTAHPNDNSKFIEFLKEDPGLKAWQAFKKFSDIVNAFEDKISIEANVRYKMALEQSYWLQVILFMVAMPTLIYSAYFASRSLKFSEQVREAEAKNSHLLANQNEMLERVVHERTNEITTQNEEIAAQNEELVAHTEQLVFQQSEIEKQRSSLTIQNKNLKEAKQMIEQQSIIIHQKNEALRSEVEKQTQDLKATNLELLEQNSRLEQFTYIISHNLRAPMARIIGLAQVIDYTKDPVEIIDLVKKMALSTIDLDVIIKDLAQILEIQKQNTQLLVAIDLRDVIAKTIHSLKREIEETSTHINIALEGDTTLDTIPHYIESIFYNLISNAIKYRQPTMAPTITIASSVEKGYLHISISDNGLGIDLERFKDKLFSLYKRFHFHVEGKGMGLYLVKTQVSVLDGKLTITSKVNEGTRFDIFFKEKKEHK